MKRVRSVLLACVYFTTTMKTTTTAVSHAYGAAAASVISSYRKYWYDTVLRVLLTERVRSKHHSSIIVQYSIFYKNSTVL